MIHFVEAAAEQGRPTVRIAYVITDATQRGLLFWVVRRRHSLAGRDEGNSYRRLVASRFMIGNVLPYSWQPLLNPTINKFVEE